MVPNIPRASAPGRLSQISQHLAAGNSSSYIALGQPPSSSSATAQYRRLSTSSTTSANMSSQPDHPTLLIPGPIEFDDAVLQSMSHYRCAGLRVFCSPARLFMS